MIIAEVLLIILMLISAAAAVSFEEELVSIICLSIFSFALTAIYVLYKAPDVALAEVVIGAGLNAAIFMAAISQVREGRESKVFDKDD